MKWGEGLAGRRQDEAAAAEVAAEVVVLQTEHAGVSGQRAERWGEEPAERRAVDGAVGPPAEVVAAEMTAGEWAGQGCGEEEAMERRPLAEAAEVWGSRARSSGEEDAEARPGLHAEVEVEEWRQPGPLSLEEAGVWGSRRPVQADVEEQGLREEVSGAGERQEA